LIPSFFESIGTEIEPSLVNSKSNFISSSSNLCNAFKNWGSDLIYVGFESYLSQIYKYFIQNM
jgi:hypothetical protein